MRRLPAQWLLYAPALFLIGSFLVQAAGPDESERPPVTIDQIEAGEARQILKVDSKMSDKCIPLQLCWNVDGTGLYVLGMKEQKVKTLEHQAVYEAQEFRYFKFDADGSNFEQIEKLPVFSYRYWEYKSKEESPCGKYKVESYTKQRTYTRAGVVQYQRYFQKSLNGKLIGENLNFPLDPGKSYSWAPRGIDAIAYINPKDDLCIMSHDSKKDKRLLKGKYTLPAWSMDGTKIAMMEAKNAGFTRWKVWVLDLKGFESVSTLLE